MIKYSLAKIFSKKKFGLSVLCFHSVNSPYKFSIDKADFFKIVNYLLANFIIISPDEFIEYYENNTQFTRNSILLTFDDGHADNLWIAQYLKQLNISAIFFLNSKLLLQDISLLKVFEKDRNENFGFDDFLNISGITDIKNMGHKIGNHLHSHTVINEQTLFYEIFNSHIILNSQNIFTRFIALPYGKPEMYELSTIDKLHKLGYIVFTLDPQPISYLKNDNLSIPRIGIGKADFIKNFYIYKIRGGVRFRKVIKGNFIKK